LKERCGLKPRTNFSFCLRNRQKLVRIRFENIRYLSLEDWTYIVENAVTRVQYFWDLPRELFKRLTPNARTTDKPKPGQLNQEQYCFLVNGQNCLTNTNTTKYISFCGNHYNTIKSKQCISIILCVIIVQTSKQIRYTVWLPLIEIQSKKELLVICFL